MDRCRRVAILAIVTLVTVLVFAPAAVSAPVCSTTYDAATKTTCTTCYEPGVGGDTRSCSTPGATEIIDVPVPPPPTTSGGESDPVTSSPDPVTGSPPPATTTPPEHPRSVPHSIPRPKHAIEAEKNLQGSKTRAKENLGYEEVPESFGQQRRRQNWGGMSEQIKRLGGFVTVPPPKKKKKPPVPLQPPKKPPPEGLHTTAPEPEEDKEEFICGPDITLVLKHFVNDLESTWHNTKTKIWDRDLGKNINPRRRACRAMAPIAPSTWTSLPGKNPKAGGAWDIQELREKKLNDVSAVCPVSPKCKNTVTVDNKCHYVGSVNYLIYGVMFRLCRSLPQMITLGSWIMTKSIREYKASQGATNTQASVDWALTGFNGWPNTKGVSTPPAEPDARGTCQPCKDRYLRPLHWHWLGLQPSGTRPAGTRPRNLNGFDGNGYRSEKSPTFDDWDD